MTGARRAVSLNHEEATAWVQLRKRLDVRPVTVPHVDLALELMALFRVQYFEALILAAARLAGCAIVYSEDLSHGQDYRGVKVVNPFAG